MKRYELEIDHESCWGCGACVVACRMEKGSIGGPELIRIMEENAGMGEAGISFRFRVNTCRHCDDAPCVEACPVQAIDQREDGIVAIDMEACTGCEACIEACPYGAMRFNDTENRAEKCDMCLFRIENGLVPACACGICLGNCIRFICRE